MVDDSQIVQAAAVLLYTAVVDTLQQIDPLQAKHVDEHERRARRATEALADWMMGLSKAQVAFLFDGSDAFLPAASDWLPESPEFDATAACAAAQRILRKSLQALKTVKTDLTAMDFMQALGGYLLEMPDQKLGWLSERAANLLAINL
jgi:hypothetical protein